MPRKAASFARRATNRGGRVGREGRNALRATQGQFRRTATGPRAALATARLATALTTPDTTSGVDGERRTLFLRHLTDHGPTTPADLHALTGLADGSRQITSRILANLHAEGLVTRTRIPGRAGHPWLYHLTDHKGPR
jgi:hypothetical protein